MSRMSIGADDGLDPVETGSSDKSLKRMRTAALVLRTVFIVSLLIVIVHVALPQSQTIWTVYQSPGDLIRLALGVLACVWVASQLFAAPTDNHANRTWVYLGLAAVPFSLVCIVYIW